MKCHWGRSSERKKTTSVHQPSSHSDLSICLAAWGTSSGVSVVATFYFLSRGPVRIQSFSSTFLRSIHQTQGSCFFSQSCLKYYYCGHLNVILSSINICEKILLLYFYFLKIIFIFRTISSFLPNILHILRLKILQFS